MKNSFRGVGPSTSGCCVWLETDKCARRKTFNDNGKKQPQHTKVRIAIFDNENRKEMNSGPKTKNRQHNTIFSHSRIDIYNFLAVTVTITTNA